MLATDVAEEFCDLVKLSLSGVSQIDATLFVTADPGNDSFLNGLNCLILRHLVDLTHLAPNSSEMFSHKSQRRTVWLLSIVLLITMAPVLADDARLPDDARQLPPGARLFELKNQQVRVGVDLEHGGAIVLFARQGEGNRINNFDLGRQVQMSFYSGPVPFRFEGQSPAKHWEHLGWNPVQAGDDFRHGSRVLGYEHRCQTLRLTCRPMQWPLKNVPADCLFDSSLKLEGTVLQARARLKNERADRTQYPARLQELPAVYANAAYHRVVSYIGSRPFTNDAVAVIPKATGTHPWSFWMGTEGWSALLDEHDQGIGLITPGRVHFTGGFAGQRGANDSLGNSTGYIAGQGQEILDHNIQFEYRYELMLGSLKEIRERAVLQRATELPAWSFKSDRQGWHYIHAKDRGWPINGQLDVVLDEDDPQLVSPFTFWNAESAAVLQIDAAIRSQQRTATVFFQGLGEPGPTAQNSISFPIQPDSEFHRYEVRLADVATYRGAMTRLRFDPIGTGAAGDWMRVRSIALRP